MVAADSAGQAAEHDLSATPVGPGAAGGPPLAAGGFFLELAGVDITGIQGHLAQSDVPFEASQLYDSLEDAKLVDTSLRRSKFRLFRDECLFDLVASRILPEANRADPDREYSLVRNDLTHIVYREGDFVRPPKSTAAAVVVVSPRRPVPLLLRPHPTGLTHHAVAPPCCPRPRPNPLLACFPSRGPELGCPPVAAVVQAARRLPVSHV